MVIYTARVAEKIFRPKTDNYIFGAEIEMFAQKQ